MYHQHLLQIPADRHRCHYVKAKVRVHEYPDHHLAVFHGPRCLVRWRPDDSPQSDQPLLLRRSPLAAPQEAAETVIHSFHNGKKTNQAVNSLAT